MKDLTLSDLLERIGPTGDHLLRAGAELVLAVQSGLDALADNPTVARAPGAGEAVSRAAEAVALLGSLAETKVGERGAERRARAAALTDIAAALREEMREVRDRVAVDPDAAARLLALAEVLSAIERQIGATGAVGDVRAPRNGTDERA